MTVPDQPSDDAELAELLAWATAPTPAPAVRYVPRETLAVRFLRANEIETGTAYSIEVAHLYQMYLAWATNMEGETRLVTPLKFAMVLTKRGFRRRRPRGARRKGGRDHRVLMVKATSAERLLAWARENPITQEQRAVFINERKDTC